VDYLGIIKEKLPVKVITFEIFFFDFSSRLLKRSVRATGNYNQGNLTRLPGRIDPDF